ncbi:hypothetical protein D3C84_1036950 [compost metagenome]
MAGWIRVYVASSRQLRSNLSDFSRYGISAGKVKRGIAGCVSEWRKCVADNLWGRRCGDPTCPAFAVYQSHRIAGQARSHRPKLDVLLLQRLVPGILSPPYMEFS